eukprot:CAMPEP_0183728492 /NCGR_PEP_ID=MMETSP0737-20130205/28178_1 /TAXON_ID=385413 /ORGANISM="Thalassiosira miniscula, Strain CCMP1093" /LENGTH=369 /DNA_ID=CAMNT_0025960445 /DNA_START=145 /DNA_END=1254 /DNA_ORIENTATION=+
MDAGIDPVPKLVRVISSSRGRFVAALICIAMLTATLMNSFTSSVDDAIDSEAEANSIQQQQFADRDKCQIIYIVGVEGSDRHHEFTSVLQKLASHQKDPVTDIPYEVTYADMTLRSAIFGWKRESRPLDNHSLVRQVIRKICPHNEKKHVIIEDSSFPAGTEDDPRYYRIHRQPWWLEATMEEIATSETALGHPTNLRQFYEAYSPYAEIKFVVLHRPYTEMIASYHDVDGTAEQHSNVIRGFLLLLRRFLDAHPLDTLSGKKLWTLVCVERIASKYYSEKTLVMGERVDGKEQMNLARQNILRFLAEFLEWPHLECRDCFDHWRESGGNHLEVLGEEHVANVLEHMRKLGGIWPPFLEDALSEQKCSL